MKSQRLTCPCGHSWDHPVGGPIPTNLRLICPVCAGQLTNSETGPPLPHSSNPEEERDKQLALAFDGFELLDVLNRGAMGVVYKARQLGFNRLVALKVIAPERAGDVETLKRFQREVKAAALLSHPNIVTVYHTDLQNRNPYLAMEYVAGIDLAKLVEQVGPLPPADACQYVLQAARGLQHAFERGLVHRDIKPANLMVTPSPLESPKLSAAERRVKILDMGLARIIDPIEGGELTQAGELLGTPDYISPEQAEDSRKADIRSDLYSLGGTLHFLLTGEPPFPACNMIEKCRRQLTEPPPSPAARRPGVWPILDSIVRLLMACDISDRFQTPTELVEALEKALRDPTTKLARGTPVSAVPTPPQISAHPSGVASLAISTTGRWLISGGLDETLRLWDAFRLCETKCIAKDVGSVAQVSIAPGAKWAASCSLRLFKHDMVVQVWDLSDGSERRRLKGAADNLRCVAINPDGRRVAGGSSDKTIRIWAVDQAGSPSIVLKGHTAEVNSVAFLSNGTILVSGGADDTLRLWDVANGAPKGNLRAEVGKVTAVASGKASNRFAFAGDGLRVRQADGAISPFNGHIGTVLCIAFSADGQYLVSGGNDRTVRVWRADDGKELRCFKGHSDKVCGVAFRPDGKAVYSGSADGTIRYWSW
jgi:eukaryotic-like serine/threonine-protein kinase